MSKFIDLTNRKFDRLTVIRRSEDYIRPNGKHITMWECECECGNKIIVRASNLISKHTKSCGCLKKELDYEKTQQKKKYNKYDLSGDFGIGYTSNTNKEFYFDFEDYDKIKDYCWRETKDGFQSYDQTTHKHIKLNRLIMNFPKDMEVIYLNHNRFDNRKQNLKNVSHMINQWGAKMRSNNTSGTTGVSMHKRKNMWWAYIMVDKHRKNLGYYKNKSDAIKARKEAEEKYFGEYSYDNRMKNVLRLN